MLEKIKAFAIQRPVIFAVIVILLSIVSTEIPLQRLFVPYMSQQAAQYVSLIAQQGLVGLVLWWLLRRFGWTRQAGFTPPAYWRALWLGWPLVVYALLNASDFLTGAVRIDTEAGSVGALRAGQPLHRLGGGSYGARAGAGADTAKMGLNA